MASSRKAQTAPDVATIVIVLFIAGIVFLVAYQLLSTVNADIQADTSFTDDAKASLQTVEDHYASTWDGIFGMAVVLLWIFLIVTALMVDTHPVFFVVTIVLLVALFSVTPIIANTYQDFSEDSDISAYAADFPIMNFVFEHLLIVVIVMGLTAGVALYAKNRGP